MGLAQSFFDSDLSEGFPLTSQCSGGAVAVIKTSRCIRGCDAVNLKK